MKSEPAKIRHRKLRDTVAGIRAHDFLLVQSVEQEQGRQGFIPQLRIVDHRSGLSSVQCRRCRRSLITDGREVSGSAKTIDC